MNNTKKVAIVSLLLGTLGLLGLLSPAYASLLILIKQTPPKTQFTMRENVEFSVARNFALLNEFNGHEKYPDTQALFEQYDDNSDSLLRFLTYADRLTGLIWQEQEQCLTQTTQNWADKLQTESDNLQHQISLQDWGTLIIIDRRTGSAIVTPNPCETPAVSYAALILKKSAEGKSHQLQFGNQLEVRSVRTQKLTNAYRLSVQFRSHPFVKSLEIITTDDPENIQLRDLHFATARNNENSPVGETFSISLPKERYF